MTVQDLSQQTERDLGFDEEQLESIVVMFQLVNDALPECFTFDGDGRLACGWSRGNGADGSRNGRSCGRSR